MIETDKSSIAIITAGSSISDCTVMDETEFPTFPDLSDGSLLRSMRSNWVRCLQIQLLPRQEMIADKF